jgi:hypothetical protein
MPPPEELALARSLAAVLDGAPGDGESVALATLLTRAAGTARIEIPGAALERALDRARPRVRRRRPSVRIGLAVAGTVAAAVAAVLIVLLSPFTSAPGLDVSARAIAALGGPATVLEVVEVITPAGSTRSATREGWIDLTSGRERWRVTVDGRLVSDTLVTAHEVRRYVVDSGVVIVGASCRAFGSACAELVDPVAFYRDALRAAGQVAAERVSVAGRPAYRFVLPARRFAGATRIEQVVTLDAETYRPVRIVWRDVLASGETREASTVDFRKIQVRRRDAVPSAAFVLDVPSGVRVEQRDQSGQPARVVAKRALTLAEARAIDPALFVLDPQLYGHPTFTEVRYSTGTVYVVRYGVGIAVWNYTDVVPPQVLAVRGSPAKTVPVGDAVANVYFANNGVIVAEIDEPQRSVAILMREGGKADVFEALDSLHPLRAP